MSNIEELLKLLKVRVNRILDFSIAISLIYSILIGVIFFLYKIEMNTSYFYLSIVLTCLYTIYVLVYFSELISIFRLKVSVLEKSKILKNVITSLSALVFAFFLISQYVKSNPQMKINRNVIFFLNAK
ncbi:MAG: hypothetical protein H6622_02015 [Halobacteriovoraceae bacterium]|nr:hypothetical protein [Halobacteriovoraceae bacterium]